jgi:succinoglycan biosynthesis transport protein ExoP
MNDSNEVTIHLLDYWRVLKARASLVALVLLAVLTTAGITIFFMPRQYFSKVTLEVKPDKFGSINIFENSSRVMYDPTFVSTQFQILQKTEILYPVIESLKLGEAWRVDGKELPPMELCNKLVRMMDLRELRNTPLIEVGIYSTNPKEAALIANRIAAVYSDKRLSDMQRNIDRGLAQLREEVEKQRRRVEEANTQMAVIRARDSINDPDPESINSTLSAADRNIVALELQLNEQRLTVTKFQGQLEQIEKMQPEELKEVLRTLNIEDQTVVKMVASLQDAIADEAKLRANGLGRNHPRIRALASQREVYAGQLADSLRTVRQSQGHKLEIELRTLQSLQQKFDTAKASQIQDKQKMGEYANAKSHYLQAKKIFEAAQMKLSAELLERGIDFEPAKIREAAEPGLRPARPRVVAYMSLALILGVTLSVGLAFFLEYLDTSVKTVDDLERYLQLPVLAAIPRNSEGALNPRSNTPAAEAYRILRANIEFHKPDPDAKTCTLVSGGAGEGKSTTLHNLAAVCAGAGYRVLVVDADLRRPVQHLLFTGPKGPGLTDCLLGRAPLDEVLRETKVENLTFMPSGDLPSQAVGILNSQRMVDLLRALKTRYDVIFVDSPPILGVSDGAILASECDMTIMVAQHRRFPRAMLQKVKQAVTHAGGKLVGVVLNQVDPNHEDVYTYSAYTEEPGSTDAKTAPPRSGGSASQTAREDY